MERTRGERQAAGLIVQRLHNLGVAVPLYAAAADGKRYVEPIGTNWNQPHKTGAESHSISTGWQVCVHRSCTWSAVFRLVHGEAIMQGCSARILLSGANMRLMKQVTVIAGSACTTPPHVSYRPIL